MLPTVKSHAQSNRGCQKENAIQKYNFEFQSQHVLSTRLIEFEQIEQSFFHGWLTDFYNIQLYASRFRGT
jgi:hypothetical protein